MVFFILMQALQSCIRRPSVNPEQPNGRLKHHLPLKNDKGIPSVALLLNADFLVGLDFIDGVVVALQGFQRGDLITR